MCYDRLSDFRKIVLRDRKINTVCLIAMLLPFGLLLWATFLDVRVGLLLWVAAIPVFICIKNIKSDNRLISQLVGIESSKALNRTCAFKLSHPRVRLLACPEIRGYVSPAPTYYGVLLKGIGVSLKEDGTPLDAAGERKKYYYFFDENFLYDKRGIENLIKKFDGEHRIECYENTSIIKIINNDPHFVRVKHGLFCE